MSKCLAHAYMSPYSHWNRDFITKEDIVGVKNADASSERSSVFLAGYNLHVNHDWGCLRWRTFLVSATNYMSYNEDSAVNVT